MDLRAFITSITISFQQNVLASVAFAILFLALLFWKPRILILILFLIGLVGFIVYVSTYLASCKQIQIWR